MSVQPVNGVSFKANVKINRGELSDLIATTITSPSQTATSLASTGGAAASTAIASASEITGSAFNVLGTAFSAKAAGINSLGIVPSTMNCAAPHLTAESVAASNNHPSIIGSVMSTIAGFFHNMGSQSTKQVKRPS